MARRADKMHGLPFYHRYPRDLIEAVVEMPKELRGHYALLLDIIYVQNGFAPDDEYDGYIPGILGISKRKWTGSVRPGLIATGRIERTEKSGRYYITNTRATLELDELDQFRRKQSRAGVARHAAPREPDQPRHKSAPQDFRIGFLSVEDDRLPVVYGLLSLHYIDGDENTGREQGEIWSSALAGYTVAEVKAAANRLGNQDRKGKPRPADMRRVLDAARKAAPQQVSSASGITDQHREWAQFIQEGQSWIGPHIKPQTALKLIEAGLVTREQCRAIDIALPKAS